MSMYNYGKEMYLLFFNYLYMGPSYSQICQDPINSIFLYWEAPFMNLEINIKILQGKISPIIIINCWLIKPLRMDDIEIEEFIISETNLS